MEQHPVTPPPTPAPAPVKKGLPPIAWVGIGCGGLLLIAIIVIVGAGFWGVNKARELGVDFQKNPERAAAELVVNMSPDLEKVSSDEEAGTITIRTKDGKVMTLGYEEITEGKYTMREPEAAPPADPVEDEPATE